MFSAEIADLQSIPEGGIFCAETVLTSFEWLVEPLFSEKLEVVHVMYDHLEGELVEPLEADGALSSMARPRRGGMSK